MRGSLATSWPVRDQGPRGTCVAFAGTASHEAARSGAVVLSEEFLYWACKQQDGFPTRSGTTLTAMSTALESDGQCLAASWPYDPLADQNSAGYGPTAAARVDAAGRQIRGNNPGVATAALVTALDDGVIPVVVLELFDTWHNVGADGLIALPAPGARRLGLHAVAVVDHEASAGSRFLVRNSWGSSWGAGGYGTVAGAYLDRYCRVVWRPETST